MEPQEVNQSSSGISLEDLKKLQESYHSDPRNRLAEIVLDKDALNSTLINRKAVFKNPHIFSAQLDVEAKATNQRSAGLCWIYAALNVFRLNMMGHFKLGELDLSHSYFLFWDKLEKSNWFLQTMIDLIEEPLNSRTVQFLLTDPIQDGGQWDMFVALVEKYGVVPKSAYPDSFHTFSTQNIRWLITFRLRDFASQLRTLFAQDKDIEKLHQEKEKMIEEIYRILCITIGEPPKTFNWEYQDKEKKCHCIKDLTPLKFYKEYVQDQPVETVSLINDPRNPYYKLYTVQHLGNVRGSPYTVRYINLPIEELKKYAKEELQSNKPVWFGCDVKKFLSKKYGLLDLKILDFEAVFNLKFEINKAQRLEYGESAMTHAMIFTGVHINESGNTERWKVENSWGEDYGIKGYLCMSDAWFSEYLYQIVVRKSTVPEEILSILEQDAVVLPPWDPMGSLA